MAKKFRRGTRRGSKRSSKRGTKRNTGVHVVSRVAAPVGFVLNVTGKTAKHVGYTAGKIVHHGFKGAKNVVGSIAKSANNMITTMVRGKATRSRRRH